MKPITYLRKIKTAISNAANLPMDLLSTLNGISTLQVLSEQQLVTQGRLLAEAVGGKRQISSLRDVEFKVFSQWGDDGIIQWLIRRIAFPHKIFVEFGVGNYRECNTRFLMMNDNWSGFVMDASESNITSITCSEYYWRHMLLAKAAFITTDNINSLLASFDTVKDIGILHIDLDGIDFWIWKEINVMSPILVILEYNSVFGVDRAITVPYEEEFDRTTRHFSGLYAGASLPALHRISESKGYAFIGCNGAGNNAYFVRRDYLNDEVREVSLEEGYVVSMFRESRNMAGSMTFLAGQARLNAIRGMPVYNVSTDEIEPL